jgi:hypothetical protein
MQRSVMKSLIEHYHFSEKFLFEFMTVSDSIIQRNMMQWNVFIELLIYYRQSVDCLLLPTSLTVRYYH